MTDPTIANDTLGMNEQAAVLLRALSCENVEVPEGVWFSTLPYCNCREQGFVVSIHRRGTDPVNIAFYEHRNSDRLCALQWVGNTPISGAVTADDIPDDVFPDKWTVTQSWHWMAIGDAVLWTRERIAEICATQSH